MTKTKRQKKRSAAKFNPKTYEPYEIWASRERPYEFMKLIGLRDAVIGMEDCLKQAWMKKLIGGQWTSVLPSQLSNKKAKRR